MKIASLRSTKSIALSPSQEKQLYMLFDAHYNSHSFLEPEVDCVELRSYTIIKLHEFLFHFSRKHLIEYILAE